MGVLRDSWCFCKGVGKSERTKAAIFTTKGPAMAKIPGAGAGFLIHRNLLLTTHANLPSVSAAEGSEIHLQNGVAATLAPHRFFVTSSVLDLTIVGLDTTDGDSNTPGLPQYLKTCSKPNLHLGCSVYLLGYPGNKELTVNEGKVVIATDSLIKMSTDGTMWSPGTAGFDVQGNLAFMVCIPMKLATSPNAKSSSTSSSSSCSDFHFPMHFGIPIPVICDWLNQHWEGSLDELSKPKLPIMRLMSSGQKSDRTCASFTPRRVFKSTEERDAGNGTVTSSTEERDAGNGTVTSSTIIVSKTRDLPGPSYSPQLTSVPIKSKESAQVQVLDVKVKGENFVKYIAPESPFREEESNDRGTSNTSIYADAEIASISSVNGDHSEVQSSSPPIEVCEILHDNGYSSEGETMYSAETAESRNYTSPPSEGQFQSQSQFPMGRSKSCVSYYNRYGTGQCNYHRAPLEMHRKSVHSQGAMLQRSNEYYSPTVSSIMKKRDNDNMDQRLPSSRPRRITVHKPVHSSPRWNL